MGLVILRVVLTPGPGEGGGIERWCLEEVRGSLLQQSFTREPLFLKWCNNCNTTSLTPQIRQEVRREKLEMSSSLDSLVGGCFQWGSESSDPGSTLHFVSTPLRYTVFSGRFQVDYLSVKVHVLLFFSSLLWICIIILFFIIMNHNLNESLFITWRDKTRSKENTYIWVSV